jgi:hypothetical protein
MNINRKNFFGTCMLLAAGAFAPGMLEAQPVAAEELNLEKENELLDTAVIGHVRACCACGKSHSITWLYGGRYWYGYCDAEINHRVRVFCIAESNDLPPGKRKHIC